MGLQFEGFYATSDWRILCCSGLADFMALQFDGFYGTSDWRNLWRSVWRILWHSSLTDFTAQNLAPKLLRATWENPVLERRRRMSR